MKPDAIKWSYFWRVLPRYLLPVVTVLSISLLALLIGLKLRRRQPPSLPTDRLIVSVLNVGHGEASWIRTPGGRFILIGGGPVGQGEHIVRSLKTAQAKKIDLLIIPYPYAETLGGLTEVLNNFPVDQVWEQGGMEINQWQSQVRNTIRQKHIPVRTARAGLTTSLDGVLLETLAPGEPPIPDAPRAANNSLVVRLTFGRNRFLWAGGLERKGEFALLSRNLDLKADWLRVARFATENASSPEFLRLVSPEIAVVSVGPNRSGYPRPETMNRLAATGAVVYRTDTQGGSLQFASNGASISGPN